MSTFITNGIVYNILTSTTAEIGSNYTYTGNANVVIPNIVIDANTSISYNVVGFAQYAFSTGAGSGNAKIRTIDTSSCSFLTYISAYAFLFCGNLTTFYFPSSLTTLGYSSFIYSGLTSIDMSNCTSLTNISSNMFVFFQCTSITSVILPPNLTYIRNEPFKGCDSLRSVTFSGTSIPTIDIDSFSRVSNSTAYYQYGTSTEDINRLKGYNYFTYYVEVNAPIIICFKENTKILTNNGYRPIQELKKGDLVKTLRDGFKPITMIGKRDVYHSASKERIKDQLYKCTQSEYPEIFEPLIITGCHSILVDNFENEEQREKMLELHGDIYITDNKYRLAACIDTRTSVYETPGNYTIYHFALEHHDNLMNYGIYANGLLVETCSERNLTELSNMVLIE
jgi:hypothetical protein